MEKVNKTDKALAKLRERGAGREGEGWTQINTVRNKKIETLLQVPVKSRKSLENFCSKKKVEILE